jgi:hypothetical protein
MKLSGMRSSPDAASGSSAPPSSARACADCSEANAKRPAGSLAAMNRTVALQKLQTPSNRTIERGGEAIANYLL